MAGSLVPVLHQLSGKGPLSLTSLLAFLSCQCSARGHLSGPGDLWSEFGLYTVIFALVNIITEVLFLAGMISKPAVLMNMMFPEQ